MERAEFEREVGAAAVLFSPFIGLFLVLWAMAPPTAAHRLASDPLIQLVDAAAGLWAIPLLTALPVAAWVAASPPSGAVLSRGLRGALAGAGLAAVGLLVLRLVFGPTLPDFVPPEESALAGITLGVGAGILEEAVFRFGVLATTFIVARRFWPSKRAAALAVVVTALAFALSHELGPGAGPFDAGFFATRLIVPGAFMSVLFLRVGPSFLVTLHAAAHVGIALLFDGPQPTVWGLV